MTSMDVKRQNLNTMDDKMKAILNRPDLSPEEKVDQYNQVLQQYQTYYQRQPEPIPVKLTSSSTEVISSIEDDVVSGVPKVYQQKAAALMKRIKEHPDLSWNERGELVIRGEPVMGTNMVDLVGDLVRRRKSFEPHGWQRLARALHDTNVPQDLIGHRERWTWMQDAPSVLEEAPQKKKKTTTRKRVTKPMLTRRWMSIK